MSCGIPGWKEGQYFRSLKRPKNIQQMLKLFETIPSSLETGRPAETVYRGGCRFDIEVAPALNGIRPGDEGVGDI